MKQLLAPIILVLTLAATSAKAQATTTNLFYAASPSGYYGIPISPVIVCSQTSLLFFKVTWDCQCSGYPNVVGPAPYRFTAKLYRNNAVIDTKSYTAAVPTIGIYFDNIPGVAGNYKSEVIFEILTQVGGNAGWQTVTDNGNNWWSDPTIDVLEKPCCPSDIFISGNYTTALTESATWIASTSQTIVPYGANVKLDATPGSYVLLVDGFEAQGGSVFVAQAYNGCSAGAPQKPGGDSEEHPSSILEGAGLEELSVYPNPTNGQLTVKHPEQIKQLQVYNLMGELILTIPTNGTTETRVDLAGYAKGSYFVKAIGMPVKQIILN
jgi:hypothetical protein